MKHKGDPMSDDTRRLDTTGYVRDPRLQAAAAPPEQRMRTRPAPSAMALPQHDDGLEPDIEIDDEDEAPPAPPPARAPRPAARPAAGAAPAAPAPAQPAETAVIELSRPYMVHGEPLKRFSMRKPVAREIGKIGNPLKFEIGEDGRIAEIEARWDRVIRYVTALSDPMIPPSTVEEFEFADLDTCAAFLGPFFLKVTS